MVRVAIITTNGPGLAALARGLAPAYDWLCQSPGPVGAVLAALRPGLR